MIDEMQDILTDNIPIMEECLSHANPMHRRKYYAGTPKAAEGSLGFYWERSTRAEWAIPCDRHKPRHWNILHEGNIGLKGLVCEKCGKRINPYHDDAQWVRTNEGDYEFEGYRVPQIMVPIHQGEEEWKILLDKREKYSPSQFYNEVLALFSAAGDKPLSEAELKRCCKSEINITEKESIDKYKRLATMYEVFAGIDWGCHDEKTRILTEGGFKYFKDLTDEDRVAQFDKDTRRMSFVRPEVRTVRDWDGDLIHFRGKSTDMMLTPTHRMLISTHAKPEWRVEDAGTVSKLSNFNVVDQLGWGGKERDSFILPGQPVSPGYSGANPKTLSMDTWLEFLGYYLSEGGLCFARKRGRKRPSCVKMSQRWTTNPEQTWKMFQCLEATALRFTQFPNPKTGDINWTIYGKQLWAWIRDQVGETSAEKRIPREFFRLSSRQLRILFDAMMLGDGSVDSRPGCRSGNYTSTSLGLCEDFQELCIRLGFRSTLSLHKPAVGNRKTRYRVSWAVGHERKGLSKRYSKIETVPYSGKVYCCKVPTGFIVTERNGRIAYQGNTGTMSYTVLFLASYFGGDRLKVFYCKRFIGQEADPVYQLTEIIKILQEYKVNVAGVDWGFGHVQNTRIAQDLVGECHVAKCYYSANPKHKIYLNPGVDRFTLHRTEMMAGMFNILKMDAIDLPRWEAFKPFAADFLSIISDYNVNLRMTVYDHPPTKPDDSFHALLYCTVASFILFPREDLLGMPSIPQISD